MVVILAFDRYDVAVHKKVNDLYDGRPRLETRQVYLTLQPPWLSRSTIAAFHLSCSIDGDLGDRLLTHLSYEEYDDNEPPRFSATYAD